MLRRQFVGDVRPVTDDQCPRFVIDLLHRVDGFNLQTDDCKFYCGECAASENLVRHYALDRENKPSRQKAYLGLQPPPNDAGALLAISRPVLREAIPSDIVGFDTEGLLYDLGGTIAIVGADGLFE